ncbi:hypothetical protein Taro_018240 [Colocasia esculenta]|uniref:Uncharacterized protein n=1 Tax=Colocasia esculenta TaxID=4460 RepID=A0A843V1V7_COLES|nr:hypothetical protein [Colocasia esculenta]
MRAERGGISLHTGQRPPRSSDLRSTNCGRKPRLICRGRRQQPAAAVATEAGGGAAVAGTSATSKTIWRWCRCAGRSLRAPAEPSKLTLVLYCYLPGWTK